MAFYIAALSVPGFAQQRAGGAAGGRAPDNVMPARELKPGLFLVTGREPTP